MRGWAEMNQVERHIRLESDKAMEVCGVALTFVRALFDGGCCCCCSSCVLGSTSSSVAARSRRSLLLLLLLLLWLSSSSSSSSLSSSSSSFEALHAAGRPESGRGEAAARRSSRSVGRSVGQSVSQSRSVDCLLACLIDRSIDRSLTHSLTSLFVGSGSEPATIRNRHMHNRQGVRCEGSMPSDGLHSIE